LATSFIPVKHPEPSTLHHPNLDDHPTYKKASGFAYNCFKQTIKNTKNTLQIVLQMFFFKRQLLNKNSTPRNLQASLPSKPEQPPGMPSAQGIES